MNNKGTYFKSGIQVPYNKLYYTKSDGTVGTINLEELSLDEIALDDSKPLKFGTDEDVSMNFDGTNFELEGTASSTPYIIGTASKNINTTQHGTITVGVDDTGYDVKLFGATSGKSFLWDESANKLIIAGDYDITGNSQYTGTVTVGVNDTGYDVKLFGATSGKYWLWDESTDMMQVNGGSQFNGQIAVGIDDSGYDVILYGATSGKYFMWDESADKVLLVGDLGLTGNSQFTGTLTVGVDDTGHDVKFYGATTGKYLLWDESDDSLNVNGKFACNGASPSAARTHVADPSGGGTSDAEARSAINSILATLEAFGLHATS